jgi:hypothetical protein
MAAPTMGRQPEFPRPPIERELESCFLEPVHPRDCARSASWAPREARVTRGERWIFRLRFGYFLRSWSRI